MIRTFRLHRRDEKGACYIAEGVEFSDGSCAVSWGRGRTEIVPRIEQLPVLHTPSTTVVVWDGPIPCGGPRWEHPYWERS